MDVVVTGIGLISALGNIEETWQGLLLGKSGIQRHQPFPEQIPQPLALIGTKPVELLTLTRRVVFEAVQDAGLKLPLPNCGVAIGSSRSQQGAWERLGQSHWLETLPHMNAIAAARQIGSTGAVLAPMAACATGIWALAQGYELLQTGQCEQAIVGAVEAPITPLTLAGFRQMGALARTGAYPFDRHREGLVLGEGGAVIVLETAELARQRSAPIYGKVLGFGLTADGYHLIQPDPSQKSAIAAVKHCLNRSQLIPSDIDFIHAHGTATQLNDQLEAQLIHSLFPQVAISSTKGATGHMLGASGALGTALSLLALKHQQLPPCVGLEDPESDLDFVRVARSLRLQNVLCFSFGFGGQNAVLALGK